jgi:hypothetical protein
MLVYLLLLLDSNSHVVDLVPHDAYSTYSMIYIMKRYESHSSHHGITYGADMHLNTAIRLSRSELPGALHIGMMPS